MAKETLGQRDTEVGSWQVNSMENAKFCGWAEWHLLL